MQTHNRLSARNKVLIYRWKEAGAPDKPKGHTTHSNEPNLVRKAVLYSWPNAIRSWWKAATTFTLEIHLAPVRFLKVSGINGSGYRSCFVKALSAR